MPELVARELPVDLVERIAPQHRAADDAHARRDLHDDVVAPAQHVEVGPEVGGVPLVHEAELGALGVEVDDLVVGHDPVGGQRRLLGEVDVVVARRPPLLRGAAVGEHGVAVRVELAMGQPGRDAQHAHYAVI